MKVESGQPKLDRGALRSAKAGDYLVRFAFGAGISAIAAIISIVFGPRLGGVLLAFPAILPASLTLIERKSNRKEAVVDATGAIMGAVGLIVFAIAAAWALFRLDQILSVVLAGVLWAVSAIGLYVLVVRLRRRKITEARAASATK
ncbi:MAG TPA: DUF3147 family protein [Candidatus Dormibacteraeota bacterium]